MFLNNYEKKKQDSKYVKLDVMYKKKVRQFEQSEKKVKDLSQKLRDWMHKYHDLELSVTEYNVASSSNSQEQEDEIKQLQTEISELNEMNSQLLEQLENSNIKPNTKKAVSQKSWAETPITELDLTSDDILPQSELDYESDDDLVLEFSPAFQAVLEKHAKACGS